MAALERRLEKLEGKAPGRVWGDVRDVTELSTHDLALYLLDQLPRDYVSLAKEMKATGCEAMISLGESWARDEGSGQSLTDSPERYVASLACEVLKSRAAPLLLERFRQGYPDRIFTAALAAAHKAPGGEHAKS